MLNCIRGTSCSSLCCFSLPLLLKLCACVPVLLLFTGEEAENFVRAFGERGQEPPSLEEYQVRVAGHSSLNQDLSSWADLVTCQLDQSPGAPYRAFLSSCLCLQPAHQSGPACVTPILPHTCVPQAEIDRLRHAAHTIEMLCTDNVRTGMLGIKPSFCVALNLSAATVLAKSLASALVGVTKQISLS